MNNKAVHRTAPATPELLIIILPSLPNGADEQIERKIFSANHYGEPNTIINQPNTIVSPTLISNQPIIICIVSLEIGSTGESVQKQ